MTCPTTPAATCPTTPTTPAAAYVRFPASSAKSTAALVARLIADAEVRHKCCYGTETCMGRRGKQHSPACKLAVSVTTTANARLKKDSRAAAAAAATVDAKCRCEVCTADVKSAKKAGKQERASSQRDGKSTRPSARGFDRGPRTRAPLGRGKAPSGAKTLYDSQERVWKSRGPCLKGPAADPGSYRLVRCPGGGSTAISQARGHSGAPPRDHGWTPAVGKKRRQCTVGGTSTSATAAAGPRSPAAQRRKTDVPAPTDEVHVWERLESDGSVKSLAAEIKDRGLVRRDNSNSSRHKGVSWHKKAQKWTARVSHGGKKEHLGVFAAEETAKARYDARCLELGVDPDAGIQSGFRGVHWDESCTGFVRHTGLHWHKFSSRWVAKISAKLMHLHGGKEESLGYFASQAEAKACRDARCQELGISADACKTWGYKSNWRTFIMVDGKKKFCGGFEATARGEVDAALAYDVAVRAAGRPEKANFKHADVEPEAEGDDDDEELEGWGLGSHHL